MAEAKAQPSQKREKREKRGEDRKKSLRDDSSSVAIGLARISQQFKLVDIDDARVKLVQAGFRGPAALTAYFASHLISPVVFGLAAIILVVLYGGAIASTLLMKVVLVLAGLAFGFVVPRMIVSNSAAKRKTEIRLVFPDALDLILICIESGMTIEQALRRVADEFTSISPTVASELATTVAELSYLGDRRQAYANLGLRTGVISVKNTCFSLSQSERFGTSIGGTLRVIVDEIRNDRIAQAEKKAASLPPLLTLPMMFFFMPVLLVVILSPAAISIVKTLSS